MLYTGSHPRFSSLFQPLQLRGATLRNRVAISGHFAGWWVGPGGLPTDAFVAYLRERALGGIGLFVIGATSPKPGSGWLQNTDDSIIPRYSALARAGEQHGAQVFAQLCHPGFRPLPGQPIVKQIPSVGAGDAGPAPARHIPSIDELQELVSSFGAAAGRAAAGGVHGLELHAHESFLHAQMLNPIWNERTDAYGGSLQNRLRFIIETLQAMRKAIPADLPMGIRLKADDMEQRGMDAADYQEVLGTLERESLVDYVNFTGGDGRLHHGPTPRMDGEWIALVGALKRTTSLPIMHAGRIQTAEMADSAVREGHVDVVCMTKTHIADPHFVRKIWEDRLDDVRYCTRCLRCHGQMASMACIYNPLTSRELTWSVLPPAARKRRVLVVGGGPGGMEAALTASARGHEVILVEQSNRVGGQAHLAAGSPLRETFRRLPEFYVRQASKARFDIRLNVTADADLVRSLAPEVVILATGSRPVRWTSPDPTRGAVDTVHEVLGGSAAGSRHVVVLDQEGGSRALVAADYLSATGISVSFVTTLKSVTPRIESMVTDEFVDRLLARGVEFFPGMDIASWTSNEVRLESKFGEPPRTLREVDRVVGLVGSAPNCGLAKELQGEDFEMHVIGDAREPRTCEEATVEGASVAREI